jgi:hypothetical protein
MDFNRALDKKQTSSSFNFTKSMGGLLETFCI